MTTIPQRELRISISDVLRRAAGGEHVTVTGRQPRRRVACDEGQARLPLVDASYIG